MTEDQFDALLDTIYLGAATPPQWLSALGQVAHAFGAHLAGHIVNSADRSSVHGVMYGVDAAAHAAFLQRWHQSNVVGSKAARQASPIVRSSDLIPVAQLKRLPMYEDFFAPNHAQHGLRLSLRRDAAGSSVVSIMRSPRCDDFGAADLALAAKLLPHLRRADFVRTALRDADLSTRAAWAALDLLPQPMLVLGGDRRMLRANREAFRLLTEDGVLWTIGGLLQVRPADMGAFERMLARAVPAGGIPGRAASMRLERVHGLPLLLVAMPLASDLLPGPAWDMIRQPAALVCIGDPTRRAQPSARLLENLFGFTAAEAFVVQSLLTGETVNGIAARSNRSIHTVRTHLARSLSKTGLTRQADLTGLLATLPTWKSES